MDQIEDGTYAVTFVPDECGPYNVSIKYGDKDVIGSPFILQAHPTGEVIQNACQIANNLKKNFYRHKSAKLLKMLRKFKNSEISPE